MQNRVMGFSRNSHVPACLECRVRKAKCSKTQPCATCVRHGRECVYKSKISRSPLTREHLTAVENRLQLLETTLGRLFPSGEMDAITRSLLTDNIPTDQSPPVASINQMSADEATPSNLIWDDESHLGQFLPLDTGTDDLHVHTGLQDPASYSQSMLAGAQSPDSMTTTNQENDFLNNYFLHYHPLYPILHEATFRSEWEGRTSTSPHWPILANIVLAFGAWLTAHARPGSDKSYFLKSRDGFQKVSFADRGDITLIQSLVLLSEFSQKQGSPEESAHYIGTAVRMAIAHNLHISLPIQQSNILNQEIGRRVWWSVYCAESCSAKIYGRPLLLPEEMLITVEPVSNIDESALTSSTSSFPPETDRPTLYTGLIQQASYYSMANRVYRRLLSTPCITPQDVHEVGKMIDAWHSSSPFCTMLIDPVTAPEWHLTARRRQILCDQSLRQLIHRPLLIKWMNMSMNSGPPTDKHSAEARCRAQGLTMAQSTIGLISESIINGTYSRLTLSFMLYAFFHALIVPLIHLKADPSSPESISCVQDIQRAELALDHLSVERDDLAQFFIDVLRRLFLVVSHTLGDKSGQPFPITKIQTNIRNMNSGPTSIFGNEELALIDNEGLGSVSVPDFSDWIHP